MMRGGVPQIAGIIVLADASQILIARTTDEPFFSFPFVLLSILLCLSLGACLVIRYRRIRPVLLTMAVASTVSAVLCAGVTWGIIYTLVDPAMGLLAALARTLLTMLLSVVLDSSLAIIGAIVGLALLWMANIEAEPRRP